MIEWTPRSLLSDTFIRGIITRPQHIYKHIITSTQRDLKRHNYLALSTFIRTILQSIYYSFSTYSTPFSTALWKTIKNESIFINTFLIDFLTLYVSIYTKKSREPPLLSDYPLTNY